MAQLRFCHPHDFKGFFYYDVEANKFAGPGGTLLNEGLALMTEPMRNNVKNLTVAIQPSKMFDVSVRNSGNKEGCLDAIQSNQSDVIFSLAEYPREAPNTTQGLVAYETILQIGSTYRKNMKTEVSQVLESVKSFTKSLWLMCFVTFITLFLLLQARDILRRKIASVIHRRRVIERNGYNFTQMATHLVRINQIDSSGLIRKIIFLCASLYSLVVVHYFCSLIKTELVTARDPPVFSSYKEIMDRGAQPFWGEGMSHDTFFNRKNAEPHRRELWDYATKNFNIEDLYIDYDPMTFLLVSLACLIERSVIIIDSLMWPIAPSTTFVMASRDPDKFLSISSVVGGGGFAQYMAAAGADERAVEFFNRFMKRFPDLHFDEAPTINLYTAVDPQERGYLLGFLINEQLDPRLRVSYEKSVRRVLEAGLNFKLAEGVKGFNILLNHPLVAQSIGERNKSRLYLEDECNQCVIIRPEIEFHALTPGNFKTIAFVFAAILPILFFILLIERSIPSL